LDFLYVLELFTVKLIPGAIDGFFIGNEVINLKKWYDYAFNMGFRSVGSIRARSNMLLIFSSPIIA
jgi:hypothetical protein